MMNVFQNHRSPSHSSHLVPSTFTAPVQKSNFDVFDKLMAQQPKGIKLMIKPLSIPLVPPELPETLVYSPKVFLGGLPVEFSSAQLYRAVRGYGDVEIIWPSMAGARSGGGYCFLIFSSDASVNALIKDCRVNDDGYFKSFRLEHNRYAQVQVRPWLLADGDYVPDPNVKIDSRLIVFVGGVPRTVRAVDIALAMSKFGAVAYAGIDMDAEHSYPKGAARIAFVSPKAYINAMCSKTVTIQVKGENKTLQLKPYLIEDAECEECTGELPIPKPGRYFCAEVSCLSYYCHSCWNTVHFEKTVVDRRQHTAYVRVGDLVKSIRVDKNRDFDERF
ncbi:unnamed protein product [Bursaphelenchus xylophilus]|uniref:(pine wood nematode) hypothetical protein n=1 Tax=Bursaphelenchus xylophilus TaxID=6326 RepID=A0A7I8XJB8_BURXY|nr:unnamed protein product [Bursaphelenchus xylophilus]CAG9125209.1 unnamed protein product [Bursaphelenchus xylophilus]